MREISRLIEQEDGTQDEYSSLFGFPMDWPLQVGESEENKEQSKGWKRSPTTRVKAACWKNLHTYQMGGESRPYPKQSGDTKVPQRGGARTRAAEERSQRAGFLAIESDGPADLTLKLLILAGDVETNPGPKKRTVRDRPTKNLLMGDSIIKPIENNESWNVRAVHGGTPEDLRDWLLNEPDMLNGADNVAILIGGNSVCSKRNRKPIADPEWTTEQIFGLVADLKRANVASIKVLGVPKRSCKKDMKERDLASTSDGPPPTKKAKNNLPKKKHVNLGRTTPSVRSTMYCAKAATNMGTSSLVWEMSWHPNRASVRTVYT